MSEVTTETTCIAFEGPTLIGAGRLADVILAVKTANDRGPASPILVFDDISSQPIELDLRGSVENVLDRLAQVEPAKAEAEERSPTPRRPGRPKLGVVSREITLLPRHWTWLADQPGGASVTVRKLVEQAKRASASVDRRRKAQNSAYQFMSVIAGNESGYEEAIRALFADDRSGFEHHSDSWPADVRAHAQRLAERAFEAPTS